MGRLVPFAEGAGDLVSGWVTSAEEAVRWAGLEDWPVSPEVFAAWHAEPDVAAFLMIDDEGNPTAYGELWDDRPEVELARLIVDPARRGQGNGRRLVAALVGEAERLSFDEVWLRVVPDNGTAIRCYLAAGFVRATPEQEAEFNAGQRRTYLWMEHGDSSSRRRAEASP